MQRARAEALGVREIFKDEPSINIINKERERKSPDLAATETFFKNSYGENSTAERKESPKFNNWLKNMHADKQTINLDREIDEHLIKTKVLTALKKSSPWKSPGQDGIITAAYKIFPAAKNILINFVIKTLRGENQIQEDDVRARMILIHKSGEESDPSNYRPIAVLNSDYKILTSTITDFITQSLADWMIPKEQLARKNVWGTTQGLLWDKVCTQAARLLRSQNYSI